MAYRDELEAAMSRAAALEAQLRRLKEEKHQDQQQLEALTALLARERERTPPTTPREKPPSPPISQSESLEAARQYWQDSHIRVVSLLIFSSVAAMFLAPLGLVTFFYANKGWRVLRKGNPPYSYMRSKLQRELLIVQILSVFTTAGGVLVNLAWLLG